MAKKQVDPRKKKDARAKKMLFVLLPLLVLICAWQVPKVLKQVRGEAAAAPPAAQTTPAPAADGTTAPSTTAPSTTAPTDTATGTVPAPAATDGTAPPSTSSARIADTDLPPSADEGQLVAFSRFEARDPFVQLLTPDDGTTAGSSTEDGATTTTPPPAPTTTPTPTTVPSTSTTGTTTPPPTATGQVSISINGTVEVVGVGTTFPSSDPAFQLVSINGDTVQIGIANGSFSSGADTITLEIGKPVTLISQPDGARYTIELVAVT